MEIKEVREQVPLACASSSKVIAPLVVVPNNNEPMMHNEPIMEEPQEVALRRSQKRKETSYFE